MEPQRQQRSWPQRLLLPRASPRTPRGGLACGRTAAAVCPVERAPANADAAATPHVEPRGRRCTEFLKRASRPIRGFEVLPLGKNGQASPPDFGGPVQDDRERLFTG